MLHQADTAGPSLVIDRVKLAWPTQVGRFGYGKVTRGVRGKISAVTTANTRAAIPTAGRVNRFTYAIRNIVAEAQRVEAAGTRVRCLNIGDAVAFGFETSLHILSAFNRGLPTGPY